MLPDTYAEIDLSQLVYNFKKIKSNTKRKSKQNPLVCSIVKANAYGHGMSEISKRLAETGTDYFGTANYRESFYLKNILQKNKYGNIPVLCLGVLPHLKNSLEEVVANKIEASISSLDQAIRLNDVASSMNKKINVHLKIDTGMNRIGFFPDDAYESIIKIHNLSQLEIKGIYSHLATSEIPKDRFTKNQINNFISLVKEVEQITGEIKIKHIQNSGGILNSSDDFFNMIRPGIILYGYLPDEKFKSKVGVKPVMSLKTRVKFLKQVKPGETISYGRNFKTKKNSLIASLPVGYGDGYPRSLSNKGEVFIKGKLYPVVGTVCMDWIMVDVTNGNIRIEDEVEIFGKNYPAYNISEKLGSIPYETLCMIAPRVERVYIN